MTRIKKTYNKFKRNLLRRSIKISNHITNQDKITHKLNRKYEYFE